MDLNCLVRFFLYFLFYKDLLAWWLSDKESACQCKRLRRHRFDPWIGKIPGGGNKAHGQRSLVGYSLWDHKSVGHNWATKQQQPRLRLMLALMSWWRHPHTAPPPFPSLPSHPIPLPAFQTLLRFSTCLRLKSEFLSKVSEALSDLALPFSPPSLLSWVVKEASRRRWSLRYT